MAWCRGRSARQRRKATDQGCSHEQAGQLDKVGQRARKGTDLAEHLEHGRTLDQVSAVFLQRAQAARCRSTEGQPTLSTSSPRVGQIWRMGNSGGDTSRSSHGCWCGAGKIEARTTF